MLLYVYVKLGKGKALRLYPLLDLQLFSSLFQTYLSRNFNLLEWSLNSSPNPETFLSLLFQRSFVTLNDFPISSYELQSRGHNREQEEDEQEQEQEQEDEQEQEEEDDVLDILEEIDARDKRIEMLKEILPYAKESLKSQEPISDELKGYLKKYEDSAFMSFQEEYGEGIKDDKKKIAEAVEAQLIDEIKERHIVSEAASENSDNLDLLPSKDYDSEESDASTIKPSKSLSSENTALSKDSNSNDSSNDIPPAKSSLLDDFADVSQVMQDWFAGDD